MAFIFVGVRSISFNPIHWMLHFNCYLSGQSFMCAHSSCTLTGEKNVLLVQNCAIFFFAHSSQILSSQYYYNNYFLQFNSKIDLIRSYARCTFKWSRLYSGCSCKATIYQFVYSLAVCFRCACAVAVAMANNNTSQMRLQTCIQNIFHQNFTPIRLNALFDIDLTWLIFRINLALLL